MSASYTSQTARIRTSSERSLVGAAIRIPAPVEPLVMASDELVNGRREAAELVQERDSRGDVSADDGELVLGERAGLPQDLVGHAQLADVVEQATEGEIAQALRRQPELVADLHGPKSDAPGVLLRIRVLLGESDEQRADVRAEEGLLLGDEVGSLEVAE